MTPKADYSVEKAMITELESHDEVDSIKGLSNIEAMDGYCLEDKLTARSSVKGRVRVNGVVKGEVHGNVSGIMNAVVNGDVQLTVLSGNVTQEDEDEPKQ